MSTTPTEEVHLWRAWLDRDGWPRQDQLPAEEDVRAAEIQTDGRRRRWVAARWALRLALSRYTGASPGQLELVAGDHGKPRLATETELRFNLSHSEGLALVAITGESDVGVDVERVGAKHPRSFYRDWSRREAVAKCTGAGIWGPIDDEGIALFDLDLGPEWAAALALRAEGEPPLRHFEVSPPDLPR
jgi:phosphopantetheinyl transferase